MIYAANELRYRRFLMEPLPWARKWADKYLVYDARNPMKWVGNLEDLYSIPQRK